MAPLGHHDRPLKRTTDVVVSGAGIVALAPVFLGVYLVVRLSMGRPVPFDRYGSGVTRALHHLQVPDNECRMRFNRSCPTRQCPDHRRRSILATFQPRRFSKLVKS